MQVNLDEKLSELVKSPLGKKEGNIAAIWRSSRLWCLVARIINGLKATGYSVPSRMTLENKCGIYSEEPVVIGDRLITSKGPEPRIRTCHCRKTKGADTEGTPRRYGDSNCECDDNNVPADAIAKASNAALLATEILAK